MNIGDIYKPKTDFVHVGFSYKMYQLFEVTQVSGLSLLATFEVTNGQTGDLINYARLTYNEVATYLNLYNNVTQTNTPVQKKLLTKDDIDTGDKIQCIQSFRGNFTLFNTGEIYKVNHLTKHGFYETTSSTTGNTNYVAISELQYFELLSTTNSNSVGNTLTPTAAIAKQLAFENLTKGDKLTVKKGFFARSNNSIKEFKTEETVEIVDLCTQWMYGDQIIINVEGKGFEIDSNMLNNFDWYQESSKIETNKGCNHYYEYTELVLFSSTIKTLICKHCGEEKK